MSAIALTLMETDRLNAFSLLNRLAVEAGACSFGVASVAEMTSACGSLPPMEELAKFPYAVSVGYRLSDAIMESDCTAHISSSQSSQKYDVRVFVRNISLHRSQTFT